jgi:hypothetical protein
MKKLNIVVASAVLAASVLNSACSGLAIREKDQASVGQVKRVAVIGFESVQPMATHAELAKIVEKGSDALEQTDPHADQMYADLVNSLSSQMNWKIVDRRSMLSNATYKKLYTQTMTGLQQTHMPVGPDSKKMLAKEIMEADAGRRMAVAGRDELMNALGVDALVVTRIDVELSGFRIFGFGPQYPQSRATFIMYGKGREKPVWHDGWIEGDKMDQSIGSTRFFDNKLLSELAVKSAKTAFAKIGTEQTK